MKRIITSIMTIALVVGLGFGATQAFFSDTETSENNQFVAGSVDLLVDSDCHYFEFQGLDDGDIPNYKDVGCFHEDGQEFGTWDEKDLTTEQFFWFEDLKPGDWGENTISLHVLDNDAWGRMFLANVVDTDNGCNEPELDDEPGCTDDGNGELDNFMSALLWLDQGNTAGFQCSEEVGDGPCAADLGEGDNVWQGRDFEPIIAESVSDDFSLPFSGLLSTAFTQSQLGEEDANDVGLYADGRMKGSTTYYVGIAWCFGNGDITQFGTPAFFCDGSSVDNTPQTDLLSGNVGFEVEQHRNNPNPFE